MPLIDRPIFSHPPFTIHLRLQAEDVGESLQWWLTDPGINDLWSWTGAGEGVRVGIVDTGVDNKHAESGDLEGRVAAAKDFTGSRYGWDDVAGHGTHVAGIIAANFRNDFGVAGLAPHARLYCAKGLGDNGSGSDKQVSDAIHWCCDQDCHVINLSLGSPAPSTRIKAAVQRCFDEGRLLFAAAGNAGGQDNVGYPAKWDTTFAVGAVNRNKVLARFSDRGQEVDGVGFGVEMLSCYKDGQFAVLSGTSMATPHVVGFAANRLSAELKHAGKVITNSLAKFIAHFAATAQDLGKAGHDPDHGNGFPISEKFFKAGLNKQSPTPPPPVDSGGPAFDFGSVQIYSPSIAGGLFSAHVPLKS